ncbi:hypothetical protein I3U40_18175 [Mycobacteroides abscessus subsp. abscessus]|uniref:hypothetical protein n=1 Tax=Mycobacteroides abscessus TaxID=36809 RepID=UPI0009A6342B|nr:hypothetical protein [Mycobacteroides abscessus]QSM92984.1 hypothetical protein I3U31_18165 [Mycobacteroides abscessus subsp. abscessus]QSM98022.1 hypothetical protein I3U40_18175 [Mycobacteroides abscessus subsp. abscessus]
MDAAITAAVEAETAAAAAQLLTDDVADARREGVPWSLEPAAVDAQRAVEIAVEARRHAEELALIAGMTDTKNNPGYRDDLLSVLPPTVTVDGDTRPAAEVADELMEAQRQAGLCAGEAKRHRMFDRDDEAEQCAAQADRWRNRAGHLAHTLRMAMVDGVTVAADAITSPIHAVGTTLREVAAETAQAVGDGLVETAESYASAVGITSESAPQTTAPSPSDSARDVPHDSDEDTAQRPMTRAERQMARELEEAREIDAAVAARYEDTEKLSTPAAVVDDDDDPAAKVVEVVDDYDASSPSRESPTEEKGSARESRPVSEMSDDELIARVTQARGHGQAQVSGHGELAGRGTTPHARGHRAVSVSEGSAPSPSAQPAAPSAPSPTHPAPSIGGTPGGGWLAALSDSDLLSLIRDLRRKQSA